MCTRQSPCWWTSCHTRHNAEVIAPVPTPRRFPTRNDYDFQQELSIQGVNKTTQILQKCFAEEVL